MKKLLSLLLALVMVICTIPALAVSVYAETYIRNVSITYDDKAVAVRDDLTGKEVTKLFRRALQNAILSEGIRIDLNCSYLAKKTGSGMISFLDFQKLSDSEEYLDSSNEYYFIINLEENSGYGFDIEDLPKATVNGSNAQVSWYGEEYVSYTGSIDVIQKVTVFNRDYVAGLDVTPSRGRVQRGRTFKFAAEVEGSDERVNWTLVGEHTSADTSVGANGLVRIGSDEEVSSFKVRATSRYNTSIYDEAVIEILDVPVTITGVTVSPSAVSVRKGMTYQFDITVEGTNYHDYTTEVIGATSGDTFVSGDYLYVSNDETASQLIFRATSVLDPAQYGEAVVTILPQLPIPGTISIDYDDTGLNLLTSEMTSYDVNEKLRSALQNAVLSESIRIDIYSSFIAMKTGSGMVSYEDFVKLDESGYLDPSYEHYFIINLEESGGYVFDVDEFPDVLVNGSWADGVSWYGESYAEPLGSIDVMVKANLVASDNVWKMSFDANGGRGDMPSEYVVRNSSYWLPECKFEAPDGYEFDYWFNEMYEGIEMHPGDELCPENDMVFKAMWKKINASAEISPITFPTLEEGYKWYDADDAAQAVKVTNTGEATLNVNGESLWLSDTSVFTLIWNAVPGNIPPGDCFSSVTVLPKTGLAAGTYTATLYFQDEDHMIGEPVSIDLELHVIGKITRISMVNVPKPLGGNSAADYNFSQIVCESGYSIGSNAQWAYFNWEGQHLLYEP